MGAKVDTQAYPLITAMAHSQAPQELPVIAELSRQTVRVQLQPNDQTALEQALARAEQGQQVLWVENTVKEAQSRYLDLAARAAELNIECGLLHSRFTAVDRARLEAYWVDAFGKPGWQHRSARGRILVGTQVLEQSLDIDADFIVSRFAPTDMLLQRLGRLWRHTQTPRVRGAECEAWLLAPDLAQAIQNPIAEFGATAHVYSAYVLCRSLQVWQTRQQLYLPDDIRSLIEATYAEQQETAEMARWLDELENGTRQRKGRQALRQLARIGLALDGKTLPESQVQTRYSEADTFDVLILRNLQLLKEQQSSCLVLLDGQEVILPWQRHRLSKLQWKKLTATLMRQLVSIRPSEAPAATAPGVLEKYGLQHCFYLGSRDWQDDESLLRIALVDQAAMLHGLHGSAAHDKATLEYRTDLGYRFIKS
ncbi:helicase-related protein [Sinimarinibacterium sp. NLF-5-8]|uniref:helicase-related protein n=1 Tax=Sinimarinibacterium sp. NLF-5-8 TaxID=2698684 RepID=UPI001EE3D2AB